MKVSMLGKRWPGTSTTNHDPDYNQELSDQYDVLRFLITGGPVSSDLILPRAFSAR